MARRAVHTPERPAYCRHCRYYLAGLPHVGLCPECGQRYNKSDPDPLTLRQVARDLPDAQRIWFGDSRRRLWAWMLAYSRAIWIAGVILGTTAVIVTFAVLGWVGLNRHL